MILFVLDWLPKVGSLLAVLLVLVAYGAAAGSFRWGIQVLLGIDQLANAILAGSSEETISARSYRMAARPDPKRRWVLARKFIDKLFWFDDDHCHMAWLSEVQRQHLPDEYKK